MNSLRLIQHAIVASANLGRAFQTHNRRSTSGQSLLIFVGIAVAVVGLVVLLAYLERRRKVRTVKKDAELILFRNLCRVHGLNAADIDLLAQLAAAKQLERRCDLFVDPGYLASSARGSGASAARYAKLHQALFGRDPQAA
jgi:hypothetical protein